jgi:hypothetical protein
VPTLPTLAATNTVLYSVLYYTVLYYCTVPYCTGKVHGTLTLRVLDWLTATRETRSTSSFILRNSSTLPFQRSTSLLKRTHLCLAWNSNYYSTVPFYHYYTYSTRHISNLEQTAHTIALLGRQSFLGHPSRSHASRSQFAHHPRKRKI